MNLAELTLEEIHLIGADRHQFAATLVAHSCWDEVPFPIRNLIASWTLAPMTAAEARTEEIWADVRTMWDPAPADLPDKSIAAMRAALTGES